MPADRISYEAATRFLYDRIDYERTAAVPYDPDGMKLQRMQELLDRLGNPLDGLAVIHVAGTKGKGSTAAMIAAVLSAAGYRTGVFSSPHLEGVEERMAVDGVAASPDQLAELVCAIRRHVEIMDRGAVQMGPTFFEITTAMALLHFRRMAAQAAVLEVGMGGRLDSTNVCRPAVSVITSISLDHTKQLGNTLTAIAREKAGIIKPRVPVVSGVMDEGAAGVIRQTSMATGSPLVQLGRDFFFDYAPARHLNREANIGHIHFRSPHPRLACDYPAVGVGSPGRHQASNAAVALATLRELSAAGWNLPETALRRGLATARCPARVEVLSRHPTVIRDAAHNVASVEALIETLDESFDRCRRILIFATTEDKDHLGMLRRLLPAFDVVLLTRYTRNPRGVPLEILTQGVRELGGRAQACATPDEAWRTASRLARPTDLICVTGSFYLAAELRPTIQSASQANAKRSHLHIA
jgi:dihydrofolate synthase/folylpolyglutamate synthase